MENETENELVIEEKTRQALLRYGGNAERVTEALKQPLAKVLAIHKKMKKDIIEDPSASLVVAANITLEIVIGRNQRKQVLQDMLDSLENREQLWVCAMCDTEVKDMVIDSDRGVEHFCPMCSKVVNSVLKDRGNIYNQKQAILEKMMNEDSKLLEWMVKMGWTGTTPQPGPTTVIQNRQQVLVLGGDGKVGEKQMRVLEELKHLPPLEAEKLRQDLKKEMIALDDEIRIAEQELEKAEEQESNGSGLLQ